MGWGVGSTHSPLRVDQRLTPTLTGLTGLLLQVNSLLDIEVVTRGEVQVVHLGESFLTAVQNMGGLGGHGK